MNVVGIDSDIGFELCADQAYLAEDTNDASAFPAGRHGCGGAPALSA